MTTNHDLPQLQTDLFLADGGIETSLIFDDGFELPDFAAFTLLDSERGRSALHRYFDRYVEIARRDGLGIVLETPTWRASPDWVSRQGLGFDDVGRLSRAAVALLLEVRRRHEAGAGPIVISGCVGPRGDGYQPAELMDVTEARRYHAEQIRHLAAAGADLISAITMTYPAEAIGVVDAAAALGVATAVSFTVETDGRLPTQQTLGSAIDEVDAATDGGPAYYMINCAHPTHFAEVFDPGADWTRRVRGLRANASTQSHAELDEAETLDPGDPDDLARRYAELRAAHPQLTVVGGCCGTNEAHVSAISAACSVPALRSAR